MGRHKSGPRLHRNRKTDPVRMPYDEKTEYRRFGLHKRIRPGVHVNNGFPHVHPSGRCMCKGPCCLSDHGCICRDCICDGTNHATATVIRRRKSYRMAKTSKPCIACENLTTERYLSEPLCAGCRLEFEAA